MKFRLLLIIFLIFSCKENNSKDYYSKEINEDEEISIKLPEIENWKELYSNNLVKERFYKDTFEGTQLIGVYLSNKNSKQLDSIDKIELDSYAIVFLKNDEQKWKINDSDLERIFHLQLKKASIGEINLDKIDDKKKIDSILSNKIDKPYFFKTFKENKNSFSAIKFIKPYEHSEPVIYVYNLINIQNHLIYAGYFQNFENINSIKKTIEMNNLIIASIINTNNI